MTIFHVLSWMIHNFCLSRCELFILVVLYSPSIPQIERRFLFCTESIKPWFSAMPVVAKSNSHSRSRLPCAWSVWTSVKRIPTLRLNYILSIQNSIYLSIFRVYQLDWNLDLKLSFITRDTCLRFFNPQAVKYINRVVCALPVFALKVSASKWWIFTQILSICALVPRGYCKLVPLSPFWHSSGGSYRLRLWPHRLLSSLSLSLLEVER